MPLRMLIPTIALFVIPVAGVSQADETPAPRPNWRCRPAEVQANEDARSLLPLMRGEDAEWRPMCNRVEPWFVLRFPDDRPVGPVMLTYSGFGTKTSATVHLESRERGGSEKSGEFSVLDSRTPTGLLEKFVFEARPRVEYRVRVSFTEGANRPTKLQVADIGLYDLSGDGRKDYWLIIGASIQAQSIRQRTFKQMAAERFPRADPVVFNLAVGGWKTQDLRKALPEFLRQHPHASYVGIHIGGNNVSAKRPYPGGAEEIREDLSAILETIRGAGKIPILARLSYRAYKGDRPVPPESNGSGPYVTNIYDPLIQQFCPLFFDSAANRGRVDAYNWFKEHPDELSDDGVHVNKRGTQSWNRLWIEQAGELIYGARPQATQPATQSSPALRDATPGKCESEKVGK